MPAKYRIGIIGHTGRGDYGHGIDLPWAEIEGCEVVAVADADALAAFSVAQTMAPDRRSKSNTRRSK